MVAEVRQAVDQAERLIDALLVLARNEQARFPNAPLELATVAEDVLDERTASGITMTRTLDEAPVTGDSLLLERLIGNLFDNAERYNIDGGTVSIETTTDADASILRVINTGDVVPADQLDRLFLPFTRLDDRTRHEGFGLGLILVSSITTVHRGTIEAIALVTGGLNSSVHLPRRGTESHRRAADNSGTHRRRRRTNRPDRSSTSMDRRLPPVGNLAGRRLEPQRWEHTRSVDLEHGADAS